MRARLGWGQPPTGWPQPQPHLPGWAPLMDPGPFPLQAARSIGRWLWPALAISGFLAVVANTFAHDDPAPGLSHRGLLSIALAALVVILLTIHRRHGRGPLLRALVEYTVVAVLAGLLVAAGAGVDQQPADHARPATAGQAKAKAKADATPKAEAGEDRPAVLKVAVKVVRAITGAVGWLVDQWRQADQQTGPGKGPAAWPLSPPPVLPLLWRCP